MGDEGGDGGTFCVTEGVWKGEGVGDVVVDWKGDGVGNVDTC